MELKQTIDQKEQEMLSEADAFIQKSTKQIDHLSRLANGRAMNLGEQIQAIDQVLSNYDPVAAWNYYAKNYDQIKDSNRSDLPQLQQILAQNQTKFEISAKNINEILEGLRSFKLEMNSLHLEMQINNPERRTNTVYEERGKDSVPKQSMSVFELGYRQNSSLKNSVAKTMNNIISNVKRGPNFRSNDTASYMENRIYEEDED